MTTNKIINYDKYKIEKKIIQLMKSVIQKNLNYNPNKNFYQNICITIIKLYCKIKYIIFL